MAPTPYPIKLYHRWGNFILWGILVDIGVIYTSYRKSQARTNIHGYIMTFLVVNSFLSALAYCYLKSYNYQYDYFIKLNEEKQDHLIFGTALMVLMIVLAINGYYIKYQLENKNTNKNLIFYKKIHQVLGNLIYIIGKMESYGGMDMSYEKKDWFIYIQIIYGVMLFLRFSFEILLPRIKYFNKVSINTEERIVCYDLIDQELQNKQWFIFKDQIFAFDQNYVHPGGQFIWQYLKNVEIGQYFYGITQIPGTNILHYHTPYSLQTILSNYYGSLHNQLNFPKSDIINWDLKNQSQLSEAVNQFDFQHPEIEFTIDFTKITPNHFVLKPQTNNSRVPTRLYTFIQCFQKPALEYLDKLYELIEGKTNVTFTDNFKTPRLSFFIKYYNTPNGFSKYITKQNPETVQIEGPFQSVFKEYSTNGQVILICGGTGILPFLDLLNYHLLMSYNQLIKHEKLVHIPQVERYITLLYSITSEKEFIGDNIILRLREIQNKLKKQNFTLVLKCRKNIDRCDTTQKRFTRDFISSYFKEENKQIFVCGPSILRNSIEKEFSDMSENTIYL